MERTTHQGSVIYRVNDLYNKYKQPETTKGYPIFEWIPGIPITDKDDKNQNKDNKISSRNEVKDDDDITENGEEGKSIEEETYEDDYLPEMEKT